MKRKVIDKLLMATILLGFGVSTLGMKALAAENVEINETNFPDPVFRQYFSEFGLDSNEDGILSENEIAGIQEIYIDFFETEENSVRSLKGIEFLDKLENLSVMSPYLEEIDLSANTELKELSFSDSPISQIDLSHNTKLKNLTLFKTKVSSLDLSNNTELESIVCNYSELTGLDVSHNPNLLSLDCYDNKITELDVSQNSLLTDIWCGNNLIKKLDLSQNSKLENLGCDNNKIKELDISQNPLLKELYCEENAIEKLDLSNNPELEFVYCFSNKISSLNLTNVIHLATLKCYKNELTQLDISQISRIEYLECNDNKISELKLSENVTEVICNNNQLTSLDLSKCERLSELQCQNNLLKELDLSAVPELLILRCEGNQIKSLDINSCPKLVDTVEGGHLEWEDQTLIYESYSGGKLTVDVGSAIECSTDGFIDINETNFPDEIFRRTVRKAFDKNDDKRLSPAEIEKALELDCPTPFYEEDLPIKSLKGVEYLTHLESLDCRNAVLDELDVSKNTKLKTLYCMTCTLEKLDVSHNPLLEILNCDANYLKELDVSQNPKLTFLAVESNQLSSIDVSHNPLLETFYCGVNEISSLDISMLEKLKYFSGNYLPVTELNLEHNKELCGLYLVGAKLKTLDLSNCPILLKYLKEGKNRSEDDRNVTYSMTSNYSSEQLIFSPGLRIVENGEEIPYVVNYVFEDVPIGKWYTSAVKWIRREGWMIGVSEKKFAPMSKMTRAQFVKILYNLAGEPKVEGKNTFEDVEDGQWYTNAVIWASANDVTHGLTKTLFGTDEPISREQLVTLVYNYAKKTDNYRMYAESEEMKKFKDSEQISSWAKEAFEWAAYNAVVFGQQSGDDLYANPKGTATRAECAVIMERVQNLRIIKE